MKAFPSPHWKLSEYEGMDLRDYFAAKAMEGFMGCYGNNIKYTDDELIATASYALADAMMKAREQ